MVFEPHPLFGCRMPDAGNKWRLFLAQLDALFFSAPHQSFNR